MLVAIVLGLASIACARQGTRWLRHRYGRPPRHVMRQSGIPADAVDVTLPSVKGRALRGWFLPAPSDDRPGPAALVMHGWGASAAEMLPVAGPLRAAGLHALLLDARCHGRSDDDEFMSMPRFAEDVRAGLVWLRGHASVDSRRIVLVGHSVGAGACLLVGATDDDVAAVVSIASMADPERFMTRALGRHLPRPLTGLVLRYVEHVIGQRFQTFAPVHTIGRVSAPVLLLHGGRDATVPVDDAHLLHEQAGGRARLHVLADADHVSAEALTEATPVLLDFLLQANVTTQPKASADKPVRAASSPISMPTTTPLDLPPWWKV